MKRTTTLGFGNKSDFTKYSMSNPGPAKYKWETYRRKHCHGKSMGLGRKRTKTH